MSWKKNVSEIEFDSKLAVESADSEMLHDKLQFASFIKNEVPLLNSVLTGEQQQQMRQLTQHADAICDYLFDVYSAISSTTNKQKKIPLRPYISLSGTMASHHSQAEESWNLLNAMKLLPVAKLWNDEDTKHEAKSKIKSVLAHELFHGYIEERYPHTDAASGEANKNRREDSRRSFEYTLDRGEIASRLFEIEVLLNSKENNPQQREADKKEADRLSQELQEEIAKAKGSRQAWAVEQQFRNFLNKFPHTRLFLKLFEGRKK